ncbi:phage tail protein [Lysobacter enzymogenes]|uniref:phage tail protein n=1 Tax=Lysobacter enzymogenes TaxID=69 RepID=UPI00384DC753
MIKPDSLRAQLAAAIPELKRDPDRMLLFIKEGGLSATLAPGFSFEYRYTLHLIITDFAGHPDAVMVPLLVWLARNQSELLANPALRDGIAFEAELLANDKVDLEIRLPLTERVGVHKQEGGGYKVEHYPEPEIESALPAGRWDVYLRGEWIGGWDAPDAVAG